MILSFLWSLLFFVIALGLLVAVHEWGHFIVARWCGVKVQRFSIGFGKAFWRRTDRHGTEFVLAVIPLGGYVKMLDERVEQVSEAELPKAFNRQSVYKRIAIIAAGPLTNFIFAVFALMLMYMLGVETVKPVVGDVPKESIAGRAFVQPGMQITRIADHDTLDWEAVNLELISHIGKDMMQVEAIWPESGQKVDLTLDLRDWQFDPEKDSALLSLGLVPYRPKVTTRIAQVADDSPAKAAGLKVNDKIVQLDGTPVQNWEQIVDRIAARPNQMMNISLQRDGYLVTLDVRVGQRQGQDSQQGYLGVVPYVEPWPDSYRFSHEYGPVGAFIQGAQKTWRWMVLSVEMIGKLISGDVSVKNLSGPISIAQGAGASAGFGLVYFLSFLALISVNLGIINLLPLPVLDGGHLLYYFIELLTGRPVPESVQEIGFRIGGALLLLLMTIAIVNDITRL